MIKKTIIKVNHFLMSGLRIGTLRYGLLINWVLCMNLSKKIIIKIVISIILFFKVLSFFSFLQPRRYPF
ncbi:MAG: hypothetical protein DRR08_00800 [Candidatus Parabeggiatoa sp. nov. 2]|nr:MAG: hypothetical protein DRR08_00800 [Gammaproteobacteria bacterium]